MAEVETAVSLGRHPGDRFVLENEIAEAVENRCPVIDLDAAQEMWPVPGEEVAALVEGRPLDAPPPGGGNGSA